MFSAGGLWYVMAGPCCCFCYAGSSAYVWVALSPLGPYVLQMVRTIEYTSILLSTPPHGSHTPCCPCTPLMLQSPNTNVIAWNATAGQYATKSQQFSVAAVPTLTGTVPMYIGQRFGSADDGLKCHDYQVGCPSVKLHPVCNVSIVTPGPSNSSGRLSM